jgi:hypothetical protein
MTHHDIQVGDVVYDLGQDGNPKMQVLSVLAEDLDEYREREDFDLADYKNHPHLPVRDDDRVFGCVYVPDDPGAEPSSGNNPYPLPAGRLARAPVETGDGSLSRIQDVIVRDLLEELLVMASHIDTTGTVEGSRVDAVLDVTGDTLDDRLVRDAEELARTHPKWQGDDLTPDSTAEDVDEGDASADSDDLGDFESTPEA